MCSLMDWKPEKKIESDLKEAERLFYHYLDEHSLTNDQAYGLIEDKYGVMIVKDLKKLNKKWRD